MPDTFVKSYCGLVDLYQRPNDLGYMLSFDNLLVETRDYFGFDTIEAAERALGWIIPRLVEDWYRLPETCPTLTCYAVLENMVCVGPDIDVSYAWQRAAVKEQLDELVAFLNNRA